MEVRSGGRSRVGENTLSRGHTPNTVWVNSESELKSDQPSHGSFLAVSSLKGSEISAYGYRKAAPVQNVYSVSPSVS